MGSSPGFSPCIANCYRTAHSLASGRRSFCRGHLQEDEMIDIDMLGTTRRVADHEAPLDRALD